MDFNPFKYKISELNSLSPQPGFVLIAEPFMDDPYFKRAVVLLVENNADGTVGFILNHPLELQLNEVIKSDLKKSKALFLGGPVQGQNLFFVHTRPDLIPDSQLIRGNLNWAGDFDILLKHLESGELALDEVRFFLGYAGWEKGQLEAELKQNAWFIAQTEESNIMQHNVDDLWKEIISSAKEEIALMANFPSDPSLN